MTTTYRAQNIKKCGHKLFMEANFNILLFASPEQDRKVGTHFFNIDYGRYRILTAKKHRLFL